MTFFRLGAGRPVIACAALVAGLLFGGVAVAADQFPFDQELLLDVARMGRVKRVPMLTVSPNGDAAIQLWCKDVPARVQVSDSAITIEAAPLPDALPAMMSDGQCSPERMKADEDLLAVIAQTTAWHTQGSALVLVGPKTLTFRASDH